MNRFLKISSLVVITLVCIQGYRTYTSASPFYPIDPHFTGQCKPITGVIGAEDITIDHANQFAYISADDRRSVMANEPVTGGIYGLDLSTPDASPVLLTQRFSTDFHPHGIYLYQNNNGDDSLFVINHRNGGEQQIEIFDIKDVNRLIHRQTISYPELISPNDIIAISPTQFYATNDHGYPPGHFMQTFEDYLGLPLSTVSYYDGSKGSIVAEGLMYSNGIAIADDLKTLYVAEILSRRISIYDRDMSDGSLNKRGEIRVDTGADNLEWDDVGNLWLGAHPKPLDFAAHAKDETKRSPSQILKIDVKSENPEFSEVYLSAGEDISASTVGAVSGDTLLIGSVFEGHILKCKL
mgnify:CR=1 FL=1